MFQAGRAEEALRRCVEAFDEVEVQSLERHPPGGPGPEGQVLLAAFDPHGQRVL